MGSASDIAPATPEQLRELWPCRLMAHAAGKGHRELALIQSVLAHNFDDMMLAMCRAAFPWFTSIEAPFFCSAGKVAKNGVVMADVQRSDGKVVKNAKVFNSLDHAQGVFRRIADDAKLSDTDRIEFFKAAANWIVCDFRLDPTMNPRDPDAKRLAVH